MKAIVANLLSKVGLFNVVFDYYNSVRGINLATLRSNSRVRRQTISGDHPLPPISLVTSSAGSTNLQWFLDGGSAAAKGIREVLSRNGTDFMHLGAVLDFGCGCGRVLRHLPQLTRADIYGTDINPRSIRWCRNHLDFGNFELTTLRPRLPFPDRYFDLVYSLSVFTHLTESLQLSWSQELLRILKPDGNLIVSLHGLAYLPDLTELEQQEFSANQLVLRTTDTPGSNRCAAYHPRDYAEHVLFRQFELVEFLNKGATGNPHQDLYLFRKPDQR